MDDEEQRAVMKRVMPLAAAHALKSTIPLFGSAAGVRGLAGTGLLVRVADERFVLTAAHVAEMFSGPNSPLRLATPSDVDDTEPIPLPRWSGYRSRPGPDGTHDDDRLDVAWIALPPDHAARLAQRFRFLDRSDIATNVTLNERTIISVHGFPSALVKSTPDAEDAEAYQYAAQIQHCVPADIEGFDPRNQFLIAADREKRRGADGAVIELPRLEGISGCGVWLLGRAASDGRLDLSGERPRLVGVENAWKRSSYIRGTRIAAAFEVLALANEKLRPALRLLLA